MMSKMGFIRFVLLVVLPTLLVIPAAGLFFSDPSPEDTEAWVQASFATRNYARADAVLSEQIRQSPCDIRLHYLLLQARLAEDVSDEKAETLCAEYLGYTTRGDADLADVGYFGLGMIHLAKQRPEAALFCLEKVQNRGLKYLHTLTGRGYEAMGDFESAAARYRREIDGGGDAAGAAGALALLMLRTHDRPGLEALCARPELRKYIPASVLRWFYLGARRPLAYVRSLLLPLIRSANRVGLIGAAGILLAWGWFLRRLDLFEPEKAAWVVVALGGGILSTFGASVLYDFMHWGMGFSSGGGLWNDLIYCIFGIGLIEEAVKIVPVLLIFRFSRQVDESIDYLIYASLCALGFSFVENILYFDEFSLFIINERGMICAIGHMFCTSLVGYGLVLARYRRQGTPIRNFLLFFALACVLHGLYDFFLLSDSVDDVWETLSLMLAFMQPVLYVRMLNNALNQSEFFDSAKCGQFARLREYLGAALAGIVLIEYLGLAARYGPTLTLTQYRPIIGFTWLLVLFFSATLGTYQLRRRVWLGIRGKPLPASSSSTAASSLASS